MADEMGLGKTVSPSNYVPRSLTDNASYNALPLCGRC